MLNRQRVILSIIQQAGGSAGHLFATKSAFLLREESASRGGGAFYQFLPYKYGPFSFCLFHEVSALVRKGLLVDTDRTWSITPAGETEARNVQPEIRTEILRLLDHHGGKGNSALINYVYERHPWYTVNSEIRSLRRRPSVELAVYTAGYEGLLVDGFLDGLLRAGIHRLIDVRNNPISRRYGFHKSTLSRLCRNVGIEYVHFPELGITSKDRQDLHRPGARNALFKQYCKTTLKAETESIVAVAKLMKEAPSAIVCMEACAMECHRSRLALLLEAQTKLPIKHLNLRG